MARKDMVIDPKESWSEWFKRNANFEEPPMIERDQLPDDKQPHKSVFSTLESKSMSIKI